MESEDDFVSDLSSRDEEEEDDFDEGTQDSDQGRLGQRSGDFREREKEREDNN